jgi:molecular chaperone GrpE
MWLADRFGYPPPSSTAPVRRYPSHWPAHPEPYDRPGRSPEPATLTATAPTLQAAPPDEASAERLTEALRDLEAAKRRVERDAQSVSDQTRAKLIADVFPVLGSLDRSIAAGSTDSALIEGVKLVRAQLEQVLRGYGLERVQSRGERFDPGQHDAVDVVWVDDPSQHDVVVDEWEAGYRLGNRVLKAAKVRVGKHHHPRQNP